MTKHRILSAIIALLVLMGAFGCAPGEDDEQVSVVCTIFPQYDFSRELAGDQIELTLLLPPGVESHSYDPTPLDILKILECDLFIYTGDEMEPWAAEILAGAGEGVEVLDLSQSVELSCADDHEEHGHDHTRDGHEHEYDPHIWTSPANAALMTDAIAAKLSELMPQDAETVESNRAEYTAQLSELDAGFAELVSQAKNTTLVFGGRFAMHYFTECYGLEYVAAYDSCSHEAEPSVHDIKHIIDLIEEDSIGAIYYEELVSPAVAEVIARQTGAKPLLLHSCHNLSAVELAEGESYLSLMRQNLENLKEGLL